MGKLALVLVRRASLVPVELEGLLGERLVEEGLLARAVPPLGLAKAFPEQVVFAQVLKLWKRPVTDIGEAAAVPVRHVRQDHFCQIWV